MGIKTRRTKAQCLVENENRTRTKAKCLVEVEGRTRTKAQCLLEVKAEQEHTYDV